MLISTEESCFESPTLKGFGIENKNLFARNCMNCADLHRNIMFLTVIFSVQICTFHSIPSKKKIWYLILYLPILPPWSGAWKHDFSLQICTFHAIPSKKNYFGSRLPIQPLHGRKAPQ